MYIPLFELGNERMCIPCVFIDIDPIFKISNLCFLDRHASFPIFSMSNIRELQKHTNVENDSRFSLNWLESSGVSEI